MSPETLRTRVKGETPLEDEIHQTNFTGKLIKSYTVNKQLTKCKQIADKCNQSGHKCKQTPKNNFLTSLNLKLSLAILA